MKNSSGVQLPCRSLPVSKNPKFFGRKDLLDKIAMALKPSSDPTEFRSVVVHGLGGLGKTQLALAFAYNHVEEFEVILWIASETLPALEQSFSTIALDKLKLPGAQAKEHTRNAALVLTWLQNTSMCAATPRKQC